MASSCVYTALTKKRGRKRKADQQQQGLDGIAQDIPSSATAATAANDGTDDNDDADGEELVIDNSSDGEDCSGSESDGQIRQQDSPPAAKRVRLDILATAAQQSKKMLTAPLLVLTPEEPHVSEEAAAAAASKPAEQQQQPLPQLRREKRSVIVGDANAYYETHNKGASLLEIQLATLFKCITDATGDPVRVDRIGSEKRAFPDVSTDPDVTVRMSYENAVCLGMVLRCFSAMFAPLLSKCAKGPENRDVNALFWLARIYDAIKKKHQSQQQQQQHSDDGSASASSSYATLLYELLAAVNPTAAAATQSPPRPQQPAPARQQPSPTIRPAAPAPSNAAAAAIPASLLSILSNLQQQQQQLNIGNGHTAATAAAPLFLPPGTTIALITPPPLVPAAVPYPHETTAGRNERH
jgi:hypothetical protein